MPSAKIAAILSRGRWVKVLLPATQTKSRVTWACRLHIPLRDDKCAAYVTIGTQVIWGSVYTPVITTLEDDAVQKRRQVESFSNHISCKDYESPCEI